MYKNIKLIFIILLIGVIFRLCLTWDGNFLFNMDNARDMVDVREMVVLHKLRLTGPTSAIEGLYNGPFWYYLLAIPFVLTSGNPYGSIILEIILWFMGGAFLLKLVSRWGNYLILPIGALWVSSNYVVLTNLYAFNPNPVILLTPVFIYCLVEYLKEGKLGWAVLSWFLAGLFFNFEMNFGVFTPVIILASLLLTKKFKLLKTTGFWLGVAAFILTLTPQILFDIKHHFIMSKSVLRFLSESPSSNFDFPLRLRSISESFFNTFSATLMNHKTFTLIIFGLFVLTCKQIKKDHLLLISFLTISIPFLAYLFLPVTVNAWHLGGEMAAGIIILGFILKKFKLFSIPISFLIIFFALSNIANFFLHDFGKTNSDPSLYRNEIAAIDYVYKYANGRNFKVYTYLPSVYDYPYQYLFWWYGNKKYSYVPGEYAYAPQKPPYIPSQDKFEGRKDNFSGLVFLIKEPNRNYTRFGWEGDFIKYNWQPIEKQMVGPIEVEIRKETNKL